MLKSTACNEFVSKGAFKNERFKIPDEKVETIDK